MATLGSFYEQRIFPWLNDKLADTPEVRRLRAELLATASGRVIEIGFGSGPNLDHYPAAVQSVAAVEPNPGMNARATERIEHSRIPVTMLHGAAEALPAPDESFDTAVSTLTLCSVADPSRALGELHRVLIGGGRLLLMEHGLACDPGVARWQQRLNGLQNLLVCGCNLNRPMTGLVERAGFRFEIHREFFLDGAPRTHGFFTIGAARRLAH